LSEESGPPAVEEPSIQLFGGSRHVIPPIRVRHLFGEPTRLFVLEWIASDRSEQGLGERSFITRSEEVTPGCVVVHDLQMRRDVADDDRRPI
jgi:hypothetical protein